jgi:hypothetical protein
VGVVETAPDETAPGIEQFGCGPGPAFALHLGDLIAEHPGVPPFDAAIFILLQSNFEHCLYLMT